MDPTTSQPEVPTCSSVVTPPAKAVGEDHTEYYRIILECDKKAVEEYDKALMALSGGALGISFTFLQFIGGPKELVATYYILLAWGAWAFCLACVLVAFYLSHLCNRFILDLISSGKYCRSGDYHKRPINKWISRINVAAGASFITGIVCLICFVNFNMQKKVPITILPLSAREPGTNATNTNFPLQYNLQSQEPIQGSSITNHAHSITPTAKTQSSPASDTKTNRATP